MPHRILQALIIAVFALAYWQAICSISNVQEPWDAPFYWTVAYPFSIALSALAAMLCRALGWLTGLIFTFGQLPFLLRTDDLDLTLALAGSLLLLLSVAPIAAAWLAKRFGTAS